MIFAIFTILSLGVAGVICGFTPVSWWWYLPLALGHFVAVIFVMLLVKFIQSPFLKKEVGGKPSAYCRFWMVHILDLFHNLVGARIKLEGEETIPKEPCLLICNHLSFFDPTTAVTTFRKRKLSIIAKESVFRYPLIAPYIRRCSFLPLDRENPRKGLATLKTASKLMTEYGMDVLIYPEGTRGATGELLPFKEGAFMVAKWAKAPIVILTVEGTSQIKKRFPLRRTPITYRVVDVITPDVVEQMRVAPLAELAREKMLNSMK